MPHFEELVTSASSCFSLAAPPILNSWSHTGYWSAIRVIGENTGAGVIYFIGAGLWSLEFVWSFWCVPCVSPGWPILKSLRLLGVLGGGCVLHSTRMAAGWV